MERGVVTNATSDTSRRVNTIVSIAIVSTLFAINVNFDL